MSCECDTREEGATNVSVCSSTGTSAAMSPMVLGATLAQCQSPHMRFSSSSRNANRNNECSHRFDRRRPSTRISDSGESSDNGSSSSSTRRSENGCTIGGRLAVGSSSSSFAFISTIKMTMIAVLWLVIATVATTFSLVTLRDELLCCTSPSLSLSQSVSSSKQGGVVVVMPQSSSSMWRLLGGAAAALSEADDQHYANLLKAGDKLLVAGRTHYSEAVAKYTEAILLAPDESKGLYRRAEIYSMMKENDKSMEDVTRAIEVNPSHHQGLVLRAKLHANVGDFVLAAEDQDRAARILKASGATAQKVTNASDLAHRYRAIGRTWSQVQEEMSALPAVPSSKAELLTRREVSGRCTDALEDLISFSKDSTALRVKRAECALAARQQSIASEELKYLLLRNPSLLEAVALNAKSLRMMGAVEQARKEVRRCLTLDPEFVPCAKLHKQLKTYTTKMDEVQDLIEKSEWKKLLKALTQARAMEVDPPNDDQLLMWECQAYVHLRNPTTGLRVCSELLDVDAAERNPSLLKTFLHRAELYLMEDRNEEAEKDVGRASSIDSNDDSVREMKQRIENIKRGAGRKDYYKLLGVPKTASTQEIRRAYRHLAKEHHPDRYAKDITPEERERKDKMFRDYNEAKEILLDDDKRRRYDAGEDVANPQAGHGGHGGGPFHHGGFPSGFGFPGGGFPGGGFPGGGGGGGGGGPGGFRFGGGNFHFRFG